MNLAPLSLGGRGDGGEGVFKIKEDKDNPLLIYIVAIPVLGVLLGGVYSIPAFALTKGKEPWQTILLAFGLFTTIAVVGWGLPWTQLGVACSIACGALVVRRSFGKLDGNLEKYGLIHAWTLMGMLLFKMIPPRFYS